jgi:hypothetical protein
MNRLSTEWLFAIGLVGIISAVGLSNITVTDDRGDGRILLILALAITAASDWCLLNVIWRGGGLWRLMSTIAMFPTIWVLVEFVRRAERTF